MRIFFCVVFFSMVLIAGCNRSTDSQETNILNPSTQPPPEQLVLAEQGTARHGLEFSHPVNWQVHGLGPNEIVIGPLLHATVGQTEDLASPELSSALEVMVEDYAVKKVQEPILLKANDQEAAQILLKQEYRQRYILLTLIKNGERYALVKSYIFSEDNPLFQQDSITISFDEHRASVMKIYDEFIAQLYVGEPTGPIPLTLGVQKTDKIWDMFRPDFYRFNSQNNKPIKITLEHILDESDFILQNPRIRIWEWDFSDNSWPDEDLEDFRSKTPTAQTQADNDSQNSSSLAFIPEPGHSYLIAVDDAAVTAVGAKYNLLIEYESD